MWGVFCTTHLGLNSERRQRMTHWQTPVYNHGKNTVGFNKLQQTSIYFCIWVIISLYHTSHFWASHERWKSPQINKKTILFLCSCFSRTGSWGKKCNTKQQWLLQVMLISEKKKTFTVLWVMRGHRLVWNGSYKFCVLSWPPSLQIPQLTTKFAAAKLSHEAKLVLLSAACGYQTRILPRCQRNSCCKLLLAILSFGGDITSLSFTLDKDLHKVKWLSVQYIYMYVCM